LVSHVDCLLMVGRGSHDESAASEMHEFARIRTSGYADIKTEIAFLAMARPLLSDKIAAIGPFGYRRVIVQPHLLFCGELVDSLERQVGEAAVMYPKTEWIVTPPLVDQDKTVTRATDLVEKVILDRCFEAGIHVVAPRRGD